MRWRLLVAGSVAVIVGVTVPALAADHAVRAGGNLDVFGPKTLTIAVGDTVTWASDGGFHNVKFPGEPAQPLVPSDPTTFNAAGVRKTFNEAGTFRYYCVAHASDENDAAGMTGTIVVGDGGSPSPTPTPTPEPVALPFTALVVETPVCVEKGCPGVRIRLRSSQKVTVDGLLKVRRPGGRTRSIAEVDFRAKVGRETYVLRRVDGKLLAPRDYTLVLTSAGFEGKQTLRFSVAPAD